MSASEPAAGGPLLQLAGTVAGERLKRALAAYAVGTATYGAAQKLYRKARSRVTYSVGVQGDDEIFDDLQEWLLGRVPEAKRRSLTARGRQASSYDECSPSDGPRVRQIGRLTLLPAEGGEQTVEIEGHKIRVLTYRPTARASAFDRQGEVLAWFKREERLTFTAHSLAGRQAVVRFLESVLEAHYVGRTQPDFYMASRWSASFDRRGDLPARALSSVVLRAGQKERIVDDLSGFLAAEGDYARLGIPWHRGYLLHGPPGTGKTSLAKAIAGRFGLDVYYIPLADLEADTSLLRLVSSVAARSVLLLEDVDVLEAAVSRQEGDHRLSLSGLLNSLDGIATPHGLITILTTNDASRLDPALVRPGRVDVAEEIGYLDEDQLERLFDSFYGVVPPVPKLGSTEIAPAEVVEAFKRNLDDPHTAAAEIEILAESREIGVMS